MELPIGYVVLTQAPDPTHAHRVARAVEEAGIPVHVEENLLADETPADSLSGVQGTRVLVPRERLVSAEAVLAALGEQVLEAGGIGEGRAEEDAAEAGAGSARRRAAAFPWQQAAILLLGLTAVFLAVLLWNRRAPEEDADDPLYTWETKEKVETAYWKRNGKPAFSSMDDDGDGVYEITHWYDQDGHLVTTTQDQDGNGIPEVTWMYGAGKDWIYMSEDRDQNGIVERRAYPEVDGVYEHLLDQDQDGHFEAREFVRAADAQVLQREEDHGRGEGWTRVK